MRRVVALVVVVAGAAGLVIGGLIAGNAAGAVARVQAVVEQNNPAFHPFQAKVLPKSGFCQEIDVPAGNRLVIEYVSAYVETSESDLLTFATVGGGSTVTHYVPLEGSEKLGTISLASQTVHFYADPSTQVTVCSGGLAIVSVSGHLVPLG